MKLQRIPKILFCHTIFPTDQQPQIVGGAEISSRELVGGLARKNYHVEVLRGIPPNEKPRLETFGDITVHCLPIDRRYWLYDKINRNPIQKLLWHWKDDWGSSPAGTAELIKSLNPDIVMLGNIVGIGSGIVDLAHKEGIKVIQTLRDYYYLCPAMTRFHNGKSCGGSCSVCYLLTRNRRKVLRRADAVISVSKFMLNEHTKEKIIDHNSITGAIYNAFPLKTEIPNSCKNKSKSVVFGYLGRISAEKGIDALISSLPIGSRLVIGGEADAAQIAAYSNLAGDKSSIEFLGFVRTEEFLSKIDVLVVPSLWEEPFGRVSVEAQQSGIPVVVSDRGGLPETVSDGISGWIYSPSNPDNLRKILQEIHNDPTILYSMADGARKNAEKFSEENNIRAYDLVIRKLLKVVADD